MVVPYRETKKFTNLRNGVKFIGTHGHQRRTVHVHVQCRYMEGTDLTLCWSRAFWGNPLYLSQIHVVCYSNTVDRRAKQTEIRTELSVGVQSDLRLLTAFVSKLVCNMRTERLHLVQDISAKMNCTAYRTG